ncbi:hypothetical protein GWK47_003682 [Chionoecetes opilio]|uniref:Uncharacterized protein n=1 Tax=Chionoecetes opilio TaxID=41210 RepID=A0A8J4YJ15_CHIOP|nr:hypothetical protein GWK47_003682 [Chionoecetes opilio]
MDVKSPLLLQDLDVPGPVRLTKKEERGLQRLCLFVVRVYAKAWMRLLSRFKPLDSTSNSSRPSAPTTKSTLRSRRRAVETVQTICGKVSEELVGCPSSTPTVLRDQNAMVTALRREEFDGEDTAPKGHASKEVGPRSPPGSFVSGRTLHFFRKLHLDEAFLDLPPDSWQMDEGSSGPLRSSGTSLW